MRKVSFLIAVCVVLAVMVATIAAQAPAGAAGGGGGRGGGGGGQGGRGAPAVAPTGPAPTGANGAADLPGIMQRVSYTNGTMRGKVTAADAAGVAEDLGALQALFTAAQAAFTKEKVGGAADLAKAAAAAAGDAQKVAKSGKVDAATTKAVVDSCNGCHNGPPAYRTKDPTTNAYMLNKP